MLREICVNGETKLCYINPQMLQKSPVVGGTELPKFQAIIWRQKDMVMVIDIYDLITFIYLCGFN